MKLKKTGEKGVEKTNEEEVLQEWARIGETGEREKLVKKNNKAVSIEKRQDILPELCFCGTTQNLIHLKDFQLTFKGRLHFMTIGNVEIWALEIFP